MAIAGAAFGASKALEDILAEQMLRAKLEQQQQQDAKRMQMEETRLQELIKQNDRDEQFRVRQEERVAGDRRQKDNVLGVRRMIGDSLMQRTGPLTAEDRRSIAAMQVESGDMPDVSLLSEPAKRMRSVTTVGPGNKPINRMVPEDEAVEEYREPKTPSGGPKTPLFVTMPDGSTVDINGIAPEGSKPYDEVRERQENKPISPQMLEYSRGLIRKIDDLIGKEDNPATPENEATENRITGRTAGVGGAVMRRMPWNNEAKDVDAELFSVASEVAIASLQKMRASSQTGGAVGNVALGEMEIMKNAVAAIQNNQSPLNLRRQLDIIRKSEQRYLDAMMQETPRPMSSRQGSSSSSTTPDDPDAEIARIRAARLKGKG